MGIWRAAAVGRALDHARSVVAAVALGVAASVALPALASAAPLQHGDLLTATPGGVNEYTPTGTFVQTLPGTAGTTGMCVDPTGELILPGVGRVSPSGAMTTSQWASDAGLDCVADGRGHVFVGVDSGFETEIDEYDLAGNLRRTFDVDGVGPFLFVSIDLGPDGCTMYYGAYGRPAIDRFNVCTDTQEPQFAFFAFTDHLQTLPGGQLLVSIDDGAELFTSTGTIEQEYTPDRTLRTGALIRGLSLDPDGSSFWLAGGDLDSTPQAPEFAAARFNIATGALESFWTAPADGGDDIADYGPPMVGSAEIAGTLDTDAPGQAEAFATRAKFSGQISNLHLYLDGSSTASQAVIGVYSNRDGAPGELLGQTTIATPAPGSWNEVAVPPVSVTAGQRYWIALLGPAGGGTIAFRDTAGRGRSFTSAQDTLTALPAQWSSQQSWSSGSLSAFGNG